MQSGPITAQGQLYLRALVTEGHTADGSTQYIYPLVERYKVGDVWASNNWKCIWRGEPARQFYRANWQALKRGAAINVLLERIRLHTDANGSELHAHIHSASLAPERWADKPEPASPAPTRPALPPEPITCSADARQ